MVLLVFFGVLLLVGASGFIASHWGSHRRGAIEEWGLGGRQFSTLVTWFLVGGDFYTAYTIIAIPALVFATGADGFFALPYTILVYPFVFVTMPRLWSVSRVHNLVTPADFVRLRYGSHWLATAITLTGIVALVPYIALQLTGIETVLAGMGLTGSSVMTRSLPVTLAFIGVAAFTFFAGLKAPASIAFAKDTMIYIVVIAAVILLPHHFGGYNHIFHKAAENFAFEERGSVILKPTGFSAYSTLALGSALAAFMYPHTITSVLASGSANVIRKNAVLLPAYTFLLGLIALLGIVGMAAGLHLESSKEVIPALFRIAFPSWFLGFAFAAITVAALIPAAIMSIAAANLFTRNVYREYIEKEVAPGREVKIAKFASVAVNAGALLFVVFLPIRYAINMQLIGGILVLQTLPAISFGLWRRLFHHQALLLGWATAMIIGLVLLTRVHMQTPLIAIGIGHHSVQIYIGILALAINLLVTALTSWVLTITGSERLADGTVPADYSA